MLRKQAKLARKRCGLSQEDVAEKLGVSRQTISN
ncbi:helix-turn-helix transcriptional regulator [Mediterraneibacter agrestimuris]